MGMKTMTSERFTWGYKVTTRIGLSFDIVRGDFGNWHIIDADGESVSTNDTKRECMIEIATDMLTAVAGIGRMVTALGTL